MEGQNRSEELCKFFESGVYAFPDANSVFVDAVRVLNRSYTRFKVSPSAYYSRFFQSKLLTPQRSPVSSDSRKRKRKLKEKRIQVLNEREKVADRRHQEARPLLFKAHECLLKANELLAIVAELSGGSSSSTDYGVENSFIELGRVWQAPLYEIILNYNHGSLDIPTSPKLAFPLFNNLVANGTSADVEAEFSNQRYILPRESDFCMSDLGQIQNLLPADSDKGYNLIIIDPPWENASAHQKSMYPTLPNKYFLSLPVKQLTHTGGSLVALWVTNREKLRSFVEEELFPAWGVRYMATHYWLKVKSDGSLISELDLFHHRPYECLLLGYCWAESSDLEELSGFMPVENGKTIISVPGAYSRKPPVGGLLLDNVPGLKPARCIELFAREMTAGWVSWGHGSAVSSVKLQYFLKCIKAKGLQLDAST